MAAESSGNIKCLGVEAVHLEELPGLEREEEEAEEYRERYQDKQGGNEGEEDDESGDQSDGEADVLPYPGFVPVAFRMTQNMRPRSWCLKLITWSYPFIDKFCLRC